jgi:hypothetical protein
VRQRNVRRSIPVTRQRRRMKVWRRVHQRSGETASD